MLIEVDQKVERFTMASSSGEILLHSVWLASHGLFLLHRRTEFITAQRSQRRDTVKGSLGAGATGSLRQLGHLLPRPLTTGSDNREEVLSGREQLVCCL